MITGNMRNLLADPRGMEVASAYLAALETKNLEAFKKLMAPDVELMPANYPPVRGRDAVAEMFRGYLRIVEGVEFEIRTIFGEAGCYAIEKVNIAAAPNGMTVRIPVVTIIETNGDGLFSSVRVYGDTADLFRKFDVARPTPRI